MEDKSKKLQVTFNSEMIKKMEEIAAQLGMTINQYVVYAVTKDIDNRINK
jgi:predicted HicB family RNase H-like nuclease